MRRLAVRLEGPWLWNTRRRIREASYLRKWVVLGALIGVVGGLGAIVFYTALEAATRLLLGGVAGLIPPGPQGEGGAAITPALRPWALPLLVGFGGLVAGFIVFRWAPEAEGHGTDAAVDAFHHHPRGIRARVPLIKVVASAITIGSGGSGGREGPTAQISAGFGSLLGRLLDLDQHDARIAVAAGIGAGIGAIFRAPLGGAVLGAEIMYTDDVESDALVPSFIASIVAYSIFGSAVGFTPIFGQQGRFTFSDPAQLVWYALIGVLSGAVGLLYVSSFYGLTERFRRWRVPRAIRPAVAGLAVGSLGIVLPGVLGTGYGWLQAGLDRNTLLALPLWLILVLPFAKILATSLSIGSGGSGGVFGPGMVIGGLLGAAVWRLLAPIAPAIPADPAPFAIVAMMALFGSVAHAPVAVMLMVAEMTGNLGMLAPAMVAVALATFVVGERTIYRSQLRTRTESPAHRFRVAMPLLATLSAGDAARAARVVVRPTDRAEAALARLRAAGLPGAPVVDPDGALRGVVSVERLEAAGDGATVGDRLVEAPDAVRAEDGLDDALGVLADHEGQWAPVVAGARFLGVLSFRDVLGAYRRALAGNVRQVRGLGSDGLLLEVNLASDSPLAGKTVAEAPWPRDAVLISIQRADALIVARGEVRLQPGDRLSLFVAPAAAEAARLLLRSPSTVESP